MWMRQGTASVTSGSSTVTITGGALHRGDIAEGYGFQPLVAGLPLYEITEIDADNSTITIAPDWQGDTASGLAFAVVPMLGAVRQPLLLLRGIAQTLEGIVDGGLMSGLTITDGVSTPFSVRDGVVTINALLAGTAFPDDPNDRTIGRPLRVGDMGNNGYPRLIGAASSLGQISTDGHVAWGSSDVPADVPPGGDAGTWLAEIKQRSGSLCVQTARRMSTTAAGPTSTNRQFTRTRSTSGGSPAVSAWHEMLMDFSIVGPMRKGALDSLWGRVLEVGDNANGLYVRFAGGIQLCWSGEAGSVGAEIASGSLWRGETAWTFPAAFSNNSKVAAFSTCRGTTRFGGAGSSITSSSCLLHHFAGASSPTPTGIGGVAIGPYTL